MELKKIWERSERKREIFEVRDIYRYATALVFRLLPRLSVGHCQGWVSGLYPLLHHKCGISRGLCDFIYEVLLFPNYVKWKSPPCMSRNPYTSKNIDMKTMIILWVWLDWKNLGFSRCKQRTFKIWLFNKSFDVSPKERKGKNKEEKKRELWCRRHYLLDPKEIM